jgi:hypothetical protein
MFFSANDKGEMVSAALTARPWCAQCLGLSANAVLCWMQAAMVHNWPQDDVQAIVVTGGRGRPGDRALGWWRRPVRR